MNFYFYSAKPHQKSQSALLPRTEEQRKHNELGSTDTTFLANEWSTTLAFQHPPVPKYLTLMWPLHIMELLRLLLFFFFVIFQQLCNLNNIPQHVF